jgi:hypothetical protein
MQKKAPRRSASQKPQTGSLLDLLRLHPRFMRSVHLERDIRDPTSSAGYKVTPIAVDAMARIGTAFQNNSTERAWRVTGDYGSGKTDFALALSRLANGSHKELPSEVRSLLPGNLRFKLALATGDSEPLGRTIIRALGKASKGRRLATADIMASVSRATTRACSAGYQGLLIVLDELGKNLEYAARHPESDDVFLLQRLAEEACRSGGRPLVVVALLHQGIAAYSSGLDKAAQREWDKVAGRYGEIVFVQSIEQFPALVAATLNVDSGQVPTPTIKRLKADMAAALRAGMYGAAAPKSLSDLAPSLFPIHPTVLPVLVRVMRRFGQNERSIFSFMASTEPMALQHHCSHHSLSQDGDPLYRLSHLFDFARANLVAALSGTSSTHQTRWGVIDEVIASTPLESHEEESVLKTVAMLSLLDAADLPATEDVVKLAVSGKPDHVARAVASLRKRGVIYERGSIKGLCLWPHTSVNLEEVFRRGQEAVRFGATNLADAANTDAAIRHLCSHIESEPLVPRAYYARTGTLRHVDVRLLPASQIDEAVAVQPDHRKSDLFLTVLVPADERRKALATQVLERNHGQLAAGHLVVVWEPLPAAISVISELLAWEWVDANTPQLLGDRYAREEVNRQIAHSRRTLHARLGGLDNLAVPAADKRLRVFTREGRRDCRPGRDLLAFLGTECEGLFPRSPQVLNELINRRQPSSAAVAARTKLVEAMATSPHREGLGMVASDSKRPAELALYLSIVRAGGFHKADRHGGWVFRLPTPKIDSLNLLPTFNEITRVLREAADDSMVAVPFVFDAISRPPFGVREGLHPVVLALYLATHHQRVALYEDETYLHTVGGQEFLRLMKEPSAFHLQYCKLEGVRGAVFCKLLSLLEYTPRDPHSPDLLDLVRPLSLFISRGVPEYARRTQQLPARVVAVRRVLLESREPVRMIFSELPQACGLPAIDKKTSPDAKELAGRIREALHTIQTAYPTLLRRLGDSLCAAFDVSPEHSKGRQAIAERAEQLSAMVTDPALKAFALRLADNALPLPAWTESVANLLTRKSPERWSDQDETEFVHQLTISSSRFKRTECALIGATHKLNGHACRIALTKSDGTEVAQLIDWTGLDDDCLRIARDEIDQVFERLGPHGLAAAMSALWGRLSISAQHATLPKSPK